MNNLKLIISISLLLLLSGCNKDEENNLQINKIHSIKDVLNDLSPKYRSETIDSVTHYLIDSYNINKSKLTSDQNGLMYDNDIILPVEDYILEMRNDEVSDKKAYYKKGKITKTSRVILKDICSLPLPDNWKSVLGAAAYEWNQLDGDLNFVSTQCSGYRRNTWITWVIPVDFPNSGIPRLVEKHNLGAIASTFGTRSGYPGRAIFLNTGANLDSYSVAERVYIMMHEIGHVIGFGHTDTPAEGGVELFLSLYSECRDVPLPNSLMRPRIRCISDDDNDGVNDCDWLRHTPCDIEAYHSFY